MLGASITSNQVLAIVAVLTLSLVIGGYVGRRWDISKKRRNDSIKITGALDLTVQELTWAVGGKPADQWNHERSPGIIEQMTVLRSDHAAFVEKTTNMFTKLLERAEHYEDSIKLATAAAAAAVLDTAAKTALDTNEAAATASAEVLATAIAAKLALVINDKH